MQASVLGVTAANAATPSGYGTSVQSYAKELQAAAAKRAAAPAAPALGALI